MLKGVRVKLPAPDHGDWWIFVWSLDRDTPFSEHSQSSFLIDDHLFWGPTKNPLWNRQKFPSFLTARSFAREVLYVSKSCWRGILLKHCVICTCNSKIQIFLKNMIPFQVEKVVGAKIQKSKLILWREILINLSIFWRRNSNLYRLTLHDDRILTRKLKFLGTILAWKFKKFSLNNARW